MTRMEEYQALRAELETAPEALENTVERKSVSGAFLWGASPPALPFSCCW